MRYNFEVDTHSFKYLKHVSDDQHPLSVANTNKPLVSVIYIVKESSIEYMNTKYQCELKALENTMFSFTSHRLVVYLYLQLMMDVDHPKHVL